MGETWPPRPPSRSATESGDQYQDHSLEKLGRKNSAEYTFLQARCSFSGTEPIQTCSRRCLQTLRNRYKSVDNFTNAEVEMPVLYGGFKLNVSVTCAHFQVFSDINSSNIHVATTYASLAPSFNQLKKVLDPSPRTWLQLVFKTKLQNENKNKLERVGYSIANHQSCNNAVTQCCRSNVF